MIRTTTTAFAFALGCSAAVWADASSVPAATSSDVGASSFEFQHCWICGDHGEEPRLDAVCFFEALAQRYRSIDVYRDVAQLVQVTSYDGEPAQRVETEIGCEVDDGEISVRTPLRQVGQWLGSRLRLRMSEPMERVRLEHDLWTAPHLSLFVPPEGQGGADQPGPQPRLEATEAHRVTVSNRTLIHLAVQAAMTRDSSERTSMEFMVDPESMLVEEVRVKRKLADGADHETTLHITPLSASADRAGDGKSSSGDVGESTRPDVDEPMRAGHEHSVQEGAKRDRSAGGESGRPDRDGAEDAGRAVPPENAMQQLVG